jgi:large conductance mechanosensitive channel
MYPGLELHRASANLLLLSKNNGAKLLIRSHKMLAEFKKFMMRGNMLDMAVGIIIGTAFGKIVSSLVSDILMPPIGFLLGRIDFSSLSIVLLEKTQNHAAVTINYGLFINTILDFVIVAGAIFIFIKQMNRFTKPNQTTTKICQYCKSTIAIDASKCPQCTSSLN